MSPSPRSVVVISTHIALLERLVANAGFTVAGAADLMINGERLVELFQPAFALVDTDLPGEQDLAAIERIRHVAPNAQVILVVGQDWHGTDTGSLDVAAVIARDDLLGLGPLLLDLEAKAAAAAGERLERRSGQDRRMVQDWTKVGWEYRQRGRRAEDRRDEPALT